MQYPPGIQPDPNTPTARLQRIESKLDELLRRTPAPQRDGGFAYTETPVEKEIREQIEADPHPDRI